MAASFLLRFWAEPRESSGARPRFGSFVSRLGTDEEHYFGDFRTLVAWLEEYLGREFAGTLNVEAGKPETQQPNSGHPSPRPAPDRSRHRGGDR